MPPPLLAAPLVFGGPAAKALAYEVVLPAISSASVAAILAQVAWRRIPDWIKEDVSFRSSSNSNKQDTDGLVSVLEKVQGWMEAASEKLTEPVPYMYAALLIYWQMASSSKEFRTISYSENREQQKACDLDLRTIKEMLELATLAYYVNEEDRVEKDLAAKGYQLQTCFTPTRPGSVGYYLSESSDTILIGIRGTSSLEELLTDACGRSVSAEFEPDASQSDAGADRNSMRIEVHAKEDSTVLTVQAQEEVEIVSGHDEQICIEQDDEDGSFYNSRHHSHVRCHEGILVSAQRLLSQVRSFVEDHVINGSQKLVIVGHSLGASAGCLLALLLREAYPQLIHSDRLCVYAIAPPPVLDHDSAIAAASYVTTIVNQSDLIARCSTANLQVFLEFLRSVSDQVLLPNDIAPTGPASTAKFLRQLQTTNSSDSSSRLWSKEAMENAMQNAQAKVVLRHPDHLYIPGKVYLLEEEEEAASDVRYTCTLTDVTASKLRQFELNGFRMLGDHTVSEYTATLDALILQEELVTSSC